MLTARGWWFLIAVILLAFVGVVGIAPTSTTIPILGLTLLVWFVHGWIVFAYRARTTCGRIRVNRVLVQGGREVPAVWAGSEFTVRITVTLEADVRLPFVLIEDRRPAEFPADDRTKAVFDLMPFEPVSFEYRLQDDLPGVIRFEGVHVRAADVAGFFYRRVFLRDPVEILVLPPLADDEGRQRGAKRFNTLPPPGVHRLRRPGGGSELLDLREYRPGDPPKMIAWKPSARRDKLITKEFESDVPVRCVLFLDASNGARVGPAGRTPVARVAGVAAAIAQAAAGNRDLVGLTVFDEYVAEVTAPARTRTHSVQLMRTLAETAAKLPDPKHTDADLLARYALPVAGELYPELLTRDVNSRPLGMYWLPVSDTRWMWVLPIPLILSALMATQAAWVNVAADVAGQLKPRTGAVWIDLLAFLFLLAFVVFFPTLFVVAFWFFHGIRGFFAPRAQRTARRKQLGAVYALLDNTGPAAVERAIHDDVYFAGRTARFLVDHRVRMPAVLYDRAGKFRFHSEDKAMVLAAALLRAVGRARDNELYVILADLTELGPSLAPIVSAVKVARARHHQIVVIVPWPADVPPPQTGRTTDPTQQSAHGTKPFRIGNLVRSVLVSRYHRGYAAMRATFTRAGATVVRLEDGDPVAVVLDRLDRARGVRVRR